MKPGPKYRIFSEHSILLDWDPAEVKDVHDQVLRYVKYIMDNFDDEIIEVVPAYHSLAVYLKPSINVAMFIDTMEGRTIDISRLQMNKQHVISIPVCYDLEFALDIEQVARANRLTIPQVIELHTLPTYKVYFLGFLPGFPYLEGLNKGLYTPRRDNPRPLVEGGSVGIGGSQTGIYTIDSPGGWNIIGKTPLELFDTRNDPPSVIHAGDFIQFESISRSEYDLLRVEVESGTFTWRKGAYHD